MRLWLKPLSAPRRACVLDGIGTLIAFWAGPHSHSTLCGARARAPVKRFALPDLHECAYFLPRLVRGHRLVILVLGQALVREKSECADASHLN